MQEITCLADGKTEQEQCSKDGCAQCQFARVYERDLAAENTQLEEYFKETRGTERRKQ